MFWLTDVKPCVIVHGFEFVGSEGLHNLGSPVDCITDPAVAACYPGAAESQALESQMPDDSQQVAAEARGLLEMFQQMPPIPASQLAADTQLPSQLGLDSEFIAELLGESELVDGSEPVVGSGTASGDQPDRQSSSAGGLGSSAGREPLTVLCSATPARRVPALGACAPSGASPLFTLKFTFALPLLAPRQPLTPATTKIRHLPAALSTRPKSLSRRLIARSDMKTVCILMTRRHHGHHGQCAMPPESTSRSWPSRRSGCRGSFRTARRRTERTQRRTATTPMTTTTVATPAMAARSSRTTSCSQASLMTAPLATQRQVRCSPTPKMCWGWEMFSCIVQKVNASGGTDQT